MNCTFANESYPSLLDFGCVEFRCDDENRKNNDGAEHIAHLVIAWVVKSCDGKQEDGETRIEREVEVLTALLDIRNKMHSLKVTAYLYSCWEREKEKKRKEKKRKREKRSRKENKQNKRRAYFFLIVKIREWFRVMSSICNVKACFYLAVT
jgi:hypothetical protein